MSSTPSPHQPPQPDSLATREDCPSPELLAAYVDGRQLWVERGRLESHFAVCDRCIALLVEVTAFRDAHQRTGEATDASREASPRGLGQMEREAALETGRETGRDAVREIGRDAGQQTGHEGGRERETAGFWGLLRRPPRLLWAASGTLALAASLLVAFLVREPARSDLDTLIAAVGDQRVTEARLVGFQHGRRPDVFRSTDPNAGPQLTTETLATVAEVQERATAAAASPAPPQPPALHTLGLSQLMTGDVEPAIQSLERATSAASSSANPSGAAPSNASTQAAFLSDLAAAYVTRGIRQNSPQDFERALAAATHALDLDRTLLAAHFNRALALEKLDRRDDARAAWNDYLKLDASSPWADEAREHLRASQPR